MTTLATTLGALTAILQSHPLCEQTAIVETREFSPDQFYFKVRAKLPHEYHFQTRVYSNFGVMDYAYQLFKEDTPLLRWDNKEGRTEDRGWRTGDRRRWRTEDG